MINSFFVLKNVALKTSIKRVNPERIPIFTVKYNEYCSRHEFLVLNARFGI
jgi:hypothetical protein